MAQLLSEVKYKTVLDRKGKLFWWAETENLTFRQYWFETEEVCRLATALFYASGCTIEEFDLLFPTTIRLWKVDTEDFYFVS